MDASAPVPPRPITVLVVGANGYLGSAVCRAFLRAAGSAFFFRVYGLVRRESTALALAADEVVPIVGSISDPESVTRTVLAQSPIWDVIVICTEPSKLDLVSEEQHWHDLLLLVQGLAKSSASSKGGPVRPMVLWSSGCKDYGTTKVHNDPELQPHTEKSPLVPHPLVRGRLDGALRALEAAHKDGGKAGFDAAIVRPTPLFGYSGSYYGAAFDYMNEYVTAMRECDEKILKIPSPEGTIMHGIHIDDCGDAYVALAQAAIFGNSPDPGLSNGKTTAGRAAIVGQAFNISGRRYETLNEVGSALAREYGFTSGVRFHVPTEELPGALSSQNTDLVFGYSQWVSSDKIRAVTGWSDRRPLFHENVGVFRLAYNAAEQGGNDNIAKTRRRMAGHW
ncbi:NAD(P)-binding domain protein [Tolypocladium capitatum]|uniref:NAD(P)-binding domain protein n=1 Tax=Tolypocladium capitatum TaxID=45235 RepID=A0A2K3QQ63_9HYPO|nr:NAD(P)-binding domain protein [Tolypocladium capitatum]